MKTRNFTIIASAVAAILCCGISSCSESDMGMGNYLVSLRPHKLYLESTGSTQLRKVIDSDNHTISYSFACKQNRVAYNFKVTSVETSWTFKGLPDWITVSPSSGRESGVVKMTVEANVPNEQERKAEIRFESTDPDWECSMPIAITQDAASPRLSWSSRMSNLPSDGGTKECEFSANFLPTVDYEGNEEQWFRATVVANGEIDNYTYPMYTLKVTANPNEDVNLRTGYVLLKYNDMVIGKTDIRQSAFSPSVTSLSDYSINKDKNGGTKELKYKANFIPTLSYDDLKDWCDIEHDTKANVIRVNVKPNNGGLFRSGTLYLMYKEKKVTSINVSQYSY